MIRLSGRVRSSLIIGGQGIRSHKLRTLLSMISLFLGVLAVIIVQTGAETAKNAALADVELNQGKDGTRLTYIEGTSSTLPITLDTLHGRSDAVALLRRPVIIGEPGVRPLNPGGGGFDEQSRIPVDAIPRDGGMVTCTQYGCEVRQGDPSAEGTPAGQAIELTLTAMTGDVRQFRPFRLESGGWLDFESDPSLSPRLVLNKAAAEGFRRHQVPAEMRVEGGTANATPRIIGVVSDGYSQPMAYVRVDELLNWLPDPTTSAMSLGLEILMSPNSQETERLLRARLAGVGVQKGEMQFDVIKSHETIAKQLSLMRMIFLSMACLVLLVGVAGILNVGLATVGERIEEFALRRAVGTPRFLLAAIVLTETLIIGLLTAGLAIGVGILGVRLGADYLGSREPVLAQLQFPWQAGVAGIIAGLAAGLLGGLIPAIRAARIPIATVMRA